MNARWRWAVLAVIYAALIWGFSSQRSTGIPLVAPWDKLAHFVEYAGFGFLVAQTFGAKLRFALLSWGIAALYGVSDEIHQSFVPGREAGWPDWVADAVGAAFGVWVAVRVVTLRVSGKNQSA